MKILLFDLDWTLITTDGAGLRALDTVFKTRFNLENATKGVSPHGKTDSSIVREMIRVRFNRDASPEEIQSLCAGYVEALGDEVTRSAGYRVLPGIPELLERLSGMPDVFVGLGTGNLKGGAEKKLARANLMRYFRFGGFADDSEDRPTLLRAGWKRGEGLAGRTVPASDVFVIGDTELDIRAGKAIGAKTVGVASGHRTLEQLGAEHPDFLFKDLSDTEKVLSALV